MRTLRTVFIILSVLGFTTLASAQKQPFTRVEAFTTAAGDYMLLNAVALNAAAATRTITLATGMRYSKLNVSVFFTHNAATTVTAQLSCMPEGGALYARRTSRSTTMGISTLYLVTETHAVTGDVNFTIEYDARSCRSMRILFGGAAAGVDDVVDVYATGVVGN